MRATFEEKTYENYFNSELDRVSSIFFPLGQVQEGYLGFDSSAFSGSRRLWRRLGFPFWFFPPFDGVSLRDIADEMEHFLGIVINDIPKMKANLLLIDFSSLILENKLWVSHMKINITKTH